MPRPSARGLQQLRPRWDGRRAFWCAGDQPELWMSSRPTGPSGHQAGFIAVKSNCSHPELRPPSPPFSPEGCVWPEQGPVCTYQASRRRQTFEDLAENGDNVSPISARGGKPSRSR
jgi:hypothetical protein